MQIARIIDNDGALRRVNLLKGTGEIYTDLPDGSGREDAELPRAKTIAEAVESACQSWGRLGAHYDSWEFRVAAPLVGIARRLGYRTDGGHIYR